ncbi:MAG: protein TolR [Alphaproteobacteria bacterium]
MAINGPSGNSRSRRRNAGGFSEINVTPFVDVSLVLLIIFMITAPMLTSGVSVDLPKTKASALPGNDEPIAITIRADGKVYLKDSEIPLDKLGPKLQAVLGEKKNTRIFVRGDKSVDYGRVMQVIGEVNQAGFTRVALLTVPPPQKAEQ